MHLITCKKQQNQFYYIPLNQYCQDQQSIIINMFGAHLNLNSISLFKTHLITTYGTHFYIFSTSTQSCEAILDVGHQVSIINFHIEQQKKNYSIHSIDSHGILIKSKFIIQSQLNDQMHIQCDVQSKKQIKPNKQNNLLLSSVFLTFNQILLIDSYQKLYHYSAHHNSLNIISKDHSFLKVLTRKSDPYAFIFQTKENTIQIYSKQLLRFIKHYVHNSKITSVLSMDQILVIGDERGKITLLYDYFTQTKNKKKQVSSVLEWHTGPVLSLASHNQYLYSAGEESTVVLWHVRDLSRDFLPRVRTAIKYLQVDALTNQIICGLSDNTVKIINLSNDKQTQTYKTIIDPKGYAPSYSPQFSIKTTSYHNGLLSLNGLPGKLQFINLFKNGSNSECQIIPRNLINPINDDQLSPHRINSFSFTKDMNVLIVSIVTQRNISYLKFYRKGIEDYELISKIQNPHIGYINTCLTLNQCHPPKFLTFSQTDKILRVWTEFSEKKKSIINIDEIYWKCSQQLKFRNLYPTFISYQSNQILIVYNKSQIVIYQHSQNGTINQIHHFSLNNTNEAQILQYSNAKFKLLIKLLILRNQQDIEIWTVQQNNNEHLQLCNNSKMHFNSQISNYFYCNGEEYAAIAFKYEQMSHLIIINKKQSKFTQSYDCDQQIQSAFWMENRLIIITSDLTLTAIDGKQFITFESSKSGLLTNMQDESMEIKTTQNDIFKLNLRWIERESTRNKKNIEDSLQGLNLLPSCTTAWQEMASRILI